MRVLSLLITTTLIVNASFAATIHVPADQPTIQAGIAVAANGDTVLVAPGAYAEHLNFLGKRVVVTSSSGPSTTFLQPSTTPVVEFKTGEPLGTQLSGFTLRNIVGNIHVRVSAGAEPLICNNEFALLTADQIIILSEHSHPRILKNLFHHNSVGNACIGVPSGSADIVNNTFYMNSRAFYSLGSAVAKNNIVTNSAEYGIYGSYADLSYNDVWNNHPDYDGGASQGAGSISLDPLYADPAAYHFSLQAESPCINTGDPNPLYNDADGSRNDMGAFPTTHISGFPQARNLGLGSEDLTHVISHTPTFNWSFIDTVGNQSAYELEVGTDNNWDVAEMWATGIVYSADSSTVYAGIPLEDDSWYTGRARVNNGSYWGGWTEVAFRMNTAPTAPSPVSPINHIGVNNNNIQLIVMNSTDAQADLLFYDFEIYSDSGLTSMVASKYNVPSQPTQTSSGLLPPLSLDLTYWWRSRVYDGYENSVWTQAGSFYTRLVGRVNVPSQMPSIQSAINLCWNGDTIAVAPGTYVENLDFFGKRLRVCSDSGYSRTTIQSAASGKPVVKFANNEDSTTILEGFTIRGASGSWGISCTAASPIIQNCDITQNSSSDDGGGFWCVNTSAKVRHNLIHHNHSGNTGGGVGGGGSNNLEISHNNIYDNTAQAGPGIGFVGSGSGVHVLRNLIWHNTGMGDYDAGIYIHGHDCSIINNTIVGNNKGITILYGQSVVITNNIVSSNSLAGILPGVGVSSYNDAWNNGSANDPGSNGISVDPLFTNPVEGDFTLLPQSPCVDAGNPDSTYNDQDGSRSDIGAFPVAHRLPLALNLNLGSESQYNVVSHTPVFHWTFSDTGGLQQSYELEVGTDVDWTEAEMWTTGTVNIGDNSAIYAGNPLQDGVRYFYRVRVSNGSNWGSWLESSFRMNTVPTPPISISPSVDSVVNLYDIQLIIGNSSDAESDSLTYDFEIYADSALTNLIGSFTGIAEQPSQTKTALLSGLTPDLQLWWRSRSYDHHEYSDWSGVSSFYTRSPRKLRVPAEFATIQACVDVSGTRDTVFVAAGTYNEHVDLLGKPVVLLSASGRDSTIIQPVDVWNSLVKFTHGEDSVTVLDGFTIRGAIATWGIYCNNSSPIIRNCEIRDCNNPAGDAGGINCYNSSAKIRNNVFHDNRAWSGAGIRTYYPRGMEISGNKFYHNQAYRGTAIYVGSSTSDVLIDRNLLVDNTGSEQYEAICCVFGHNYRIVNNTIIGGLNGIFSQYAGNVVVLNNIIAFNAGIGITSDSAFVDYNDFWNNGSYSDPGVHGISLDPLFVDTALGDFNLTLESPCINAGDPNPEYNDPNGTRNDMGALPCQQELPFALNLHLRAENSTHVISHTPALCWTFYDTAGVQTGYEVEVGTDNDWASAEMWSTGAIISSDTSVMYSGASLLNGIKYYLRIRVRDQLAWGSWVTMSMRMNTEPSIPLLSYPVGHTAMSIVKVLLTIQNSNDAQSDSLAYDFQIFADSTLMIPVANEYGVPEQSMQTSSNRFVGLTPNQVYWWRARAADGFETSDWSGVEAFNTRLAATILVPQNQTSVQAGINAAVDGDTVLVAPGTYNEHLNFAGKWIVVTSAMGKSTTILQSTTYGIPVVTFENTEDTLSVLEGFQIRGATGSWGIYCNGSSPIIRNCEVTQCTNNGGDGAGIWCINSRAKIRNNFIHGNHAGVTGGGIAGFGSLPLEMSYNVISDNWAPNGSGIGFLGPTSNLQIFRNLIRGNTGDASLAGGIYVNGTSFAIVNNTILENSAGIYLLDGTGARVVNNVVVSNVLSSIVAAGAWNDYNDCWGNGWTNVPGQHGISLDPQFANAGVGDYSLKGSSYCIDAGCPELQYNDPDGSRSDIGAYWFASNPGDADGSGVVDISDVVFLIEYIFGSGPAPRPFQSGDADCSSGIDISDVVYLIEYIFAGGPPPCAV